MPKYIVDLVKKQESTATVEVWADTPYEARKAAISAGHDSPNAFVVQESDIKVEGNPRYVRTEGLINKFTPYWEKFEKAMTDLGYSLRINDTEDEPGHFSKGTFIKENKSIRAEIYLTGEQDHGNVKLTPVYPTYEFDHTDDPHQIAFGLTLLLRTYKSRLTKFVAGFEKAHAAASKAVQELAEAVKRGERVAARINAELKISTYHPVKVTPHRRDGTIKFLVESSNISNPQTYAQLASILADEGIA